MLVGLLEAAPWFCAEAAELFIEEASPAVDEAGCVPAVEAELPLAASLAEPAAAALGLLPVSQLAEISRTFCSWMVSLLIAELLPVLVAELVLDAELAASAPETLPVISTV